MYDLSSRGQPEALSFRDYAEMSREFAFYSDRDSLRVGMVEEFGEFLAKAVHLQVATNNFAGTSQETLSEAGKELGDMLWYVTRVFEEYIGTSLKDVAISALRKYAKQETPYPHFSDLDRAVMSEGHRAPLSVINYKLMAVSASNEVPIITLQDSPFYVLSRRWNGLLNHGAGAQVVLGPRVGSDYEDLADIDRAVDIIWSMGWIANHSLGTTLEDVAKGNLEKLDRRKRQGTLIEGYDVDRSN